MKGIKAYRLGMEVGPELAGDEKKEQEVKSVGQIRVLKKKKNQPEIEEGEKKRAMKTKEHVRAA